MDEIISSAHVAVVIFVQSARESGTNAVDWAFKSAAKVESIRVWVRQLGFPESNV